MNATKPSVEALQAIADSCDTIQAAAQEMTRAGILNFGVESLTLPSGGTLRYVNLGDTYDTTILREGCGELTVGSRGSFVEVAESEHEADTDTVRCGYCGEFTPLCDKALAEPAGARHSWRETVCEHCGHCVDGRL